MMLLTTLAIYLGCPVDPLLQAPRASIDPTVQTLVHVEWVPKTEGYAWISWQSKDQEFRTPEVQTVGGVAQRITLLGIPSQTTVSPVLHERGAHDDVDTALTAITTGPLPRELPVPILTDVVEGAYRPEPWLLLSVDAGGTNFTGPWFTLVVNAAGEVVWYRRTSGRRMTWQARVSGNQLLLDETNTYVTGDDTLTALSLDLSRRNTLNVPRMMLAYDEMPDGSLLYGTGGRGDSYDLVRQHPDGTMQTVWACEPWMAQWQAMKDLLWACAANTVHYSETRNSVLYSMFQTNTVVEVGLDGTVLGEWGQFPGGYTFDPPFTNLDHQHQPQWVNEDTLLTQTNTLGNDDEQWLREYRIDEETGVATVVKSLPTQHVALYGGHAQRLDSGHYLWAHGTAGVVEELTEEGEPVWALDFGSHVLGNATPIDDLYTLVSASAADTDPRSE